MSSSLASARPTTAYGSHSYDDPESFNVLGARVHAFTVASFCESITDVVARGEKRVIGYHNLHSLYLYHRDAEMRRFYKHARWVFIDGMPIVLVGRMKGFALARDNRLTVVDWIEPVLGMAATRRWKVFYLGSAAGVAERGCSVFRKKFPELQITAANGFFDSRGDSDENKAVLATINKVAPDMLLVGMGMPRQERWLAENIGDLDVRAVITVGAAIDYFADVIPMPPRWMGRFGLEWAYRLWSEPKRLTGRYLLEPWSILPLLFRDLFSDGGLPLPLDAAPVRDGDELVSVR
jgi:N-acetylglucosaminyldiphosphoundecaprenol N-acetyl-beta-D-mannosaminyltransferase